VLGCDANVWKRWKKKGPSYISRALTGSELQCDACTGKANASSGYSLSCRARRTLSPPCEAMPRPPLKQPGSIWSLTHQGLMENTGNWKIIKEPDLCLVQGY